MLTEVTAGTLGRWIRFVIGTEVRPPSNETEKFETRLWATTKIGSMSKLNEQIGPESTNLAEMPRTTQEHTIKSSFSRNLSS